LLRTMPILAEKITEFRGHTQAIYNLAPSYREGHFLSCGAEGIVAEWNWASEEAKALVQADSPVYAMRLFPERQLLVLGLRSGELAFCDLHSGKILRRVQLHRGAVFDLQPFPQADFLLASGEDGAISVWDLERLDHIHVVRIANKSVRTIAFSPDGLHIATGTSDGRVRLFDIGLSPTRELAAPGHSVFRVLWRADSQVLYSTGRDAHLTAHSISGADVPAPVPAHTGAVNDLIWHPGQHHLLSGSMDKSIKVWEAATFTLQKVINFQKQGCHFNGVNRILWWEDRLLSCGDDRKIMAWQLDT
jgi:centriolar protein POC1